MSDDSKLPFDVRQLKFSYYNSELPGQTNSETERALVDALASRVRDTEGLHKAFRCLRWQWGWNDAACWRR